MAGVWIGFDQPKKIKANSAGGLLAAPAWVEFMNDVYERRSAPPDWRRPPGLTGARIDNTTGFLATHFCPPEVTEQEWYLPGTEPRDFCPIHNWTFRGISMRPGRSATTLDR